MDTAVIILSVTERSLSLRFVSACPQWPMLELCTFAIFRNIFSGIACLLTAFLSAVDAHLYLSLLAYYSRTALKEHLLHLDEPPSQEHGTSRSIYPVAKFSIAVPSWSV
jgi:hypothetical protein